MGDAVRRVQKHLQELSRDHLVSIEDSHHENLGWLQIQLQQLCKQIEVEVRVELTRPPRLSFSKPLVIGSTTTAPVETDLNATEAPAEAVRTKRPESELEHANEEAPRVAKRLRLDDAEDVVESEGADHAPQPKSEVTNVEPMQGEGNKRIVKRTVKRVRMVMRPKEVVKIIKKMVKKERTVLPSIDVSALKVVDLKTELKKRGLKQTGVKAVLVSRLKEALDAEDAQHAEQEEDEEVEIEERIVEKIMEEVEEEYEEEIEEVVADEAVHNPTAVVREAAPIASDPAPEQKNLWDGSDSVDETASAHPSDTVDDMESTENTQFMEVSEDMFVETKHISVGDADMKPKVETVNTDSATASETVDLTQANENTNGPGVLSTEVSATPNPKTSLSGILTGSSLDEIVRESAGSEFLSPDLKTAAMQSFSLRKSPYKRVTTSSADRPKSPRAETLPSIAEVESQSPEEILITDDQVSITSTTQIAAKTSQSTSPLKSDSVEAGSQPNNERKSKHDDERPRRRSLRNSSNVSEKSPVVAESQVIKKSVLITLTSTTPNTTAFSTETPTLSDVDTPSTETTSSDRTTKSILTSDRSSSVSSLAETRRYTGSMSFVEDSQPDQSPHRPSLMNEFSASSQSSARSVSTSQLEIQMTSSKMKTPDASTAVPPPSERVAQSEPRPTAVKQKEDDEAERKRREHQENIEREAQRLRMAVKQSAKKRFEEARGSSLFWAKREQTKLQIHTESSAVRSSVSNTPATPRDDEPQSHSGTPRSYEPAHSTSSSSLKELSRETAKENTNDQMQRTEQPPVEQTKTAPPSSSSTQVETKTLTEHREFSSSRVTSSSEADVNRKSETKSSASFERAKPVPDVKRSLPTRKRSNDALDTSVASLYPSKKRASLTKKRVSDEATAKRNSLTRGTSSSVNRTGASREADVPASRTRSSLGRDKSTLSSQNKRSSVVKQPEGTDSVKSSATTSSSRPVSRVASASSGVAKRRDSVSSTVSSSSNTSAADINPKPTSLMSGGAVRKPANLVSGLHSFTSLLEKDSANLSSSQGSTSSSSRQAPVVSSLKLAEKSRLIEQKKNLEKAKRKEALMKRYEEQRKADEEKKKKLAQMKEKAERDARSKREQEKAAEKKQRELELAKKRQQRIQEMRAGMEKKKAEASATSKSTISAAPVSRVAAAASSKTTVTSSQTMTMKSTKSGHHNSKSKEITTYEISENEEESSESEDENDTRRNSKNIPVWALRENLERALNEQFGPNAIDPTPSIFPDFVDSCDLEAIFEPTDVKKKKRFQRRTSSGNWLADRPTAREKAMYKRDMGFQR